MEFISENFTLFFHFIFSLQISDNLIPLDRTFSPKEMKIAGWSSNLLENASAEVSVELKLCKREFEYY